jgi:transposase-like protein
MIITKKILKKVELTAQRIEHGIITLSIHIRDRRPRCKLCQEEWLDNNEELATHNEIYTEEDTVQHWR